MAKKGINKGLILETAEKLLEEKGYEQFSLREIAAKLGVKPSSLYNHIKGFDEIRAEIAITASKKMGEALKKATEDKLPDEAFIAGAKAYREFALNYPELYKVYMRKPQLHNEDVMNSGFESFVPIRNIVLSYGLSGTAALNFIRALRSMMCGFMELTNNGYMQKGKISKDESYDAIVKAYLNVLKELKS